MAFNGKVQIDIDEKGKSFTIITKALRFIKLCAQEIPVSIF